MRNIKISQLSVELTAVIVVLLFFGFRASNIGALFNSDALYLPVLLDDLVHGGHLSDWYLTPSPYLFPDLIFFYLIDVAGIKGYWTIVCFAVLQVLIYSFLLRRLFESLDIQQSQVRHAIALYVMLIGAIVFGKAYQYVLISAHHFSVITVSVFILCLIFEPSSRTLIATTLALTLSFLMGLSDSLFIVQLTIPLTMAVFIISGIRGEYRLFVIGTMILVFSVLGYLTYPLLIANPMRYSADIGLLKFSKLIHDHASLSKVDQVNIMMLALVTLTTVVCVVRIKRLKMWLRDFRLNQGLSIVFVFCSIAINSLIVALTVNLEASDRYFIPVAVLSSVGIAFYVTRLKMSHQRWVIATLFLIVVIKFGVLYEKNGMAFNYEGEKVTCLNSAVNEFSLESGVAEYWDAKRYQFLVDAKFELAQFTYDGSPYYWITSSKFFNKDHTFFLISDESRLPNMLNREMLFKLNGLPTNSRRCESTTIYIYDRPIKLHM